MAISWAAAAPAFGAGPDSPDSSAASAASATETATPKPPATPLDEGWNSLLTSLQTARGHVLRPWKNGPAPDDRALAEGHRYLLGHLVRVIESELQQHPDFPAFQRSVRPLSKWTIDNPDTLYLTARIDPDATYRIGARVADTAQWRTGERSTRGTKSPRLVTFQTTTERIGDTGQLSEFADCRNETLGFVQHFEIRPDPNGRFEVWVGPEKPEGAQHYLPTRREMECVGPDGTFSQLREAHFVNLRETFSDWRSEAPMVLEIVRVDRQGAPRPPLDSKGVARSLETIGTQVANQISFWNQLHEMGLELFGDRNGDGRRAMPVNGMNPAAPPFIAGGTAGARQLYSAGKFELGPDEALVVKVTTPLDPHYIGFQLANFWGESTDHANYVSSRSGAQLPEASDGARYYVVAGRDPGVPGWIDTTGLREGQMSMRFVFRQQPGKGDLPRIETRKTSLDKLRRHLPRDTPTVSAEERREEVSARQSHMQRRYRQY